VLRVGKGEGEKQATTRREMVSGSFSFPSLLGGGMRSKSFQELVSERCSRVDFFLSRNAIQKDSPNEF
jgi:hypothetical protein